jgi:hypothetical protein
MGKQSCSICAALTDLGSKYPLCSTPCASALFKKVLAESRDTSSVDDRDTRDKFRLLWHEHTAYTREVIVTTIALAKGGGATAGQSNFLAKALEATIERLLENQDHLGDLFGDVLGDAVTGRAISKLLRVHIVGAKKIVDAYTKNPVAFADVAKLLRGDDKVDYFPGRPNLSDEQKKIPLLGHIDSWYQNGLDIVTALAAKGVVEIQAGTRSFNLHLWQTIVEAVKYYEGDFAGSIASADRATKHMLAVSDLLYDGAKRRTTVPRKDEDGELDQA